MATTLAVVELWPAIHGLSPRSPLAGIARRRFAGKTLLEWLVRRVSDAISLDQIVSLQVVEAGAAEHRVVAVSTEQPVVACVAGEGIVALTAKERVPSLVTGEGVVSPAAVQIIIAWARGEFISPQDVVSVIAKKRIASTTTT